MAWLVVSTLWRCCFSVIHPFPGKDSIGRPWAWGIPPWSQGWQCGSVYIAMMVLVWNFGVSTVASSGAEAGLGLAITKELMAQGVQGQAGRVGWWWWIDFGEVPPQHPAKKQRPSWKRVLSRCLSSFSSLSPFCNTPKCNCFKHRFQS